jgi:hypothetical protein
MSQVSLSAEFKYETQSLPEAMKRSSVEVIGDMSLRPESNFTRHKHFLTAKHLDCIQLCLSKLMWKNHPPCRGYT